MALTEYAPQIQISTFDQVADDPYLIIHDSLKTSTRSNGGVLTAGTTATYTDNGMFNGGDGWVQWTLSAGDKALCENSCHIHFEIESTIQENTGDGDHRIINSAQGAIRTLVDNGGNIVSRWSGGTLTPSNYILDGERDRSHNVFDIFIFTDACLTYIDGLLIGNEGRAVTANTFTTLTLFASQLGTDIWGWPQRIRNFYVRAGTFTTIRHPQLSNIVMYGDSLFQQGNLPAGLPDSNGTAGTDHADLCATGAIHKRLSTKGIKAEVLNRAVSGDKLADLQTDITATSESNIAGKAVIVLIGINDAKTGTLTVGFTANYLTLITDILALGADHVFVCTVTPTADDTTYPWATAKPAVLAANTAIAAAADSSSDVTLIDLYSYSGGDSYISADYKPTDLHWSATGSNKFGDYIAKQVMKKYGL